METQNGTCEHRWRYFVNVQARAIRVRECERCGKRAIIPTSPRQPNDHDPSFTGLFFL